MYNKNKTKETVPSIIPSGLIDIKAPQQSEISNEVLFFFFII